MALWIEWFRCVLELRRACSRRSTFVWMCLVLVGFSIRTDLLGVTSFVRACFLRPVKYRRLLHFFHSPALKLQNLTELWTMLVLKLFRPVTCQDHLVLVADGLKVPKEGKKMPAVKALHQESQDNAKPAFIMGHSLQAVGLLAMGLLGGLFCVPLASRIHEGLVWSNRHRRTLLDKLVALLLPIAELLGRKTILLADAYYASRKIILPTFRGLRDAFLRVSAAAASVMPCTQRPESSAGAGPAFARASLPSRSTWRSPAQRSGARGVAHARRAR